MDDAVVLVEIEAIKRLKARYCRQLDAKNWPAWRSVFADDFISDNAEAGGMVIAGADEFVAYIRRTLGKPSQPTVHQVHAPEIELTSDSTATGVWALNDVVRLAPGVNCRATATTMRPTKRPPGSGASRPPSSPGCGKNCSIPCSPCVSRHACAPSPRAWHIDGCDERQEGSQVGVSPAIRSGTG